MGSPDVPQRHSVLHSRAGDSCSGAKNHEGPPKAHPRRSEEILGVCESHAGKKEPEKCAFFSSWAP